MFVLNQSEIIPQTICIVSTHPFANPAITENTDAIKFQML